MNAFLWTMLVLSVLNALGNAIFLARGERPTKSPGGLALDLIGHVVFAAWAAHLLLTRAA